MAAVLELVRGFVREDALGAMLYGSSARGDSKPNSDVDVLQLVSSVPGTTTHGSVSIVSYLPCQLEAMVAGRSLFTWHLLSEGIYLTDENGELRRILNAHEGVDTAATLKRIRGLTAVLDVGELEYQRYPAGLSRVCRYLLRTAVYARAFDAGSATFALEAATGAIDSSGTVSTVLTRLRSAGGASWPDYVAGRDHLGALVDGLNENVFRSLEALVVRTAGDEAGLHALSLHAISEAVGELDYATTTMPVL